MSEITLYEELSQTIDKLDDRIDELKAKLSKAVEALNFYGERNNWKSFDYSSEVKDIIHISDLGCKSYSEEADYAIPSGGRIAREALKEIGEI